MQHYLRSARPLEMTSDERLLTSPDGTRIWAEAIGDPSNPAVVFIHGLACSATLFDKQFLDPVLLDRLYMVRYEMRGHGRSDTPASIEAYASVHQAEDFRAVCEAFQVWKPWVFGWSLGGTIPVDIANHLGPSYISGVIYNGGAVLSLALCVETIPESFVPLMPYVQSTDADTIARFAQRFVEGCVADPVATLPWPVKLQWMGSFAAQPPAVRAWSHDREQDETRWRAEARSWRVMLIQGAEDTHCRAAQLAAQVRDLYDDAEVYILEGVGHSPQFERPDIVNGLILNFIEKGR
ncbi:alpha/beta-hydrolase [Rhodofomes roseus]|uniref:Alpha/beta-hydrolase n=1 Tax=Rhodofomes roseus TaxID=34475 RepID=A0ABQ8KJC5_9APHY|nr:alpha/beta-hydrolase [Rhodofomes roseus]KAH9838238.1 alpha/beta-hydrolase [Rhodofomes roseus]